GRGRQDLDPRELQVRAEGGAARPSQAPEERQRVDRAIDREATRQVHLVHVSGPDVLLGLRDQRCVLVSIEVGAWLAESWQGPAWSRLRPELDFEGVGRASGVGLDAGPAARMIVAV